MLHKLRQLDIYKRVQEGHSQQTTIGGILSFVSVSIITLLFVLETYHFFTDPYDTHLTVGGLQTTDRFRVDLNISFYHIPCEIIAAHYTDQSGSHFTATSLRRVRISNRGVYLWDREPGALKMDSSTPPKKASCGTCYGAELSENQCCNTCEEVFEAYQKRRWALPHKNQIEQCRRSLQEVTGTEGCLLYGYLMLKKVNANFHFALNTVGKMMFATQSLAIDGSHTVHSVDISDPEFSYPRRVIENYSVQDLAITQYYLRIVPTTYPNGAKSYEASVQVGSIDLQYTPEITFEYDIDPIVTNYVIKRTFSEYLVHLCGIIGGWYALTLFVSKLINR